MVAWKIEAAPAPDRRDPANEGGKFTKSPAAPPRD
jgi:hypothetical protein